MQAWSWSQIESSFDATDSIFEAAQEQLKGVSRALALYCRALVGIVIVNACAGRLGSRATAKCVHFGAPPLYRSPRQAKRGGGCVTKFGMGGGRVGLRIHVCLFQTLLGRKPGEFFSGSVQKDLLQLSREHTENSRLGGSFITLTRLTRLTIVLARLLCLTSFCAVLH